MSMPTAGGAGTARAESTASRGDVLVLNGPNLELLGEREPAVYGTATLADVEELCRVTAAEHGFGTVARQSNHEGVLLDAVNGGWRSTVAVVINPGGFTHTSVALMDALGAYPHPVVEVHLSNVHRREAFRRHSYVSAVADAVIIGAGVHGYALAVRHVASLLG
jgi:3-dehydroquinate dehydratase-2